jgi:pyridoxamine 5'-phosphate oxidase
MSKQLHKNPKVEVCFYNNPAELPQAKQMRVTGEVEFVEDAEIKQQIYEKVKFLDDLAGRSVEPLLEVFRIKSGEAHFWTLADVLKEPELERMTF